jgi:hypothetical protein
MDLTSFLRKHKPLRHELERRIDELVKRGARPTAGDVDRFAALHKQASSHLAYM